MLGLPELEFIPCSQKTSSLQLYIYNICISSEGMYVGGGAVLCYKMIVTLNSMLVVLLLYNDGHAVQYAGGR